MPAILFYCPTTGLSVQGWIVNDPTAHPEQNLERYELVTCPVCTRIHLVNPKTCEALLGEKLARRVWGSRADRAMPNEELPHFSDWRLLIARFQSVNDLRRIIRRSLELIERSQIMLRELDIHGADRNLSANLPQPRAALPVPPDF
jgi:hypothetical protein